MGRVFGVRPRNQRIALDNVFVRYAQGVADRNDKTDDIIPVYKEINRIQDERRASHLRQLEP